MTVSGGLTALHAGFWMRITYSPGSTNTGDGQWCEISGVSGTTVTLVRAYGGTSIVAGTAACTIAQMPLLPGAYHDLPWIWASAMYWQKEDDKRSRDLFSLHGSPPEGNQPATGRIKDLIRAYGSPTTDMVIDSGEEKEIVNPNLIISL